MISGAPASQMKCSVAIQEPCKYIGGEHGIANPWHVVSIKAEKWEAFLSLEGRQILRGC